jgi:hypothetical protein
MDDRVQTTAPEPDHACIRKQMHEYIECSLRMLNKMDRALYGMLQDKAAIERGLRAFQSLK